MYGTGTSVTTDNFFISCELVNFLLTKNTSLVGMVGKNPEVLTLFLSGKQGWEYSSSLVSTSDIGITDTSKQQEYRLPSAHHVDTCMGEERKLPT
jgi:hypothetical protein